jgi:hypothetical protein
LGCIYLQDAGQWPAYDNNQMPYDAPLANEAASSNRFQVTWTPTYNISAPTGDAQCSSFVLTGLRRNFNLATVPDLSTRGSFSYSITTVGGVHTVTLWNGNNAISQGVAVGSTVIFASLDNYGVSGTCSLAYSADLVSGISYVECQWPASYQVWYSTTALTYSGQSPAKVNDAGDGTYFWMSPVLTTGAWNYNVLSVSDEGVVQASPSAPSDSPKQITNPPAPTAILSVSGTAAALKVNWARGILGSTYTVYYSYPGGTVNFDPTYLPAPITTLANAVTTTLPAITGYAPFDGSTLLAALVSSYASVAAAVQSAFSSGKSSFDPAVLAAQTSLQTAIRTFELGFSINMQPYKEDAWNNTAALINTTTSTTQNTLLEWQQQVAGRMNEWLGWLGNEIVGNASLYSDSATLYNVSALQPISVIVQPIVRIQPIYVVVRATYGGVQESGDDEFQVEFDATGQLVGPRPNDPVITALSLAVKTDGTHVYMTVEANDLNGATASAQAQGFWAYASDAIDFTSPAATSVYSQGFGGYSIANLEMIVPTAYTGLAKFACRSISNTGTQSVSGGLVEATMNAAAPAAPSTLSASVQRGGAG